MTLNDLHHLKTCWEFDKNDPYKMSDQSKKNKVFVAMRPDYYTSNGMFTRTTKAI